jgi:hypothetical protein
MKIYSFFKLLNHKIKQYEKAASNPFGDKYRKYPITLIWVADTDKHHDL